MTEGQVMALRSEGYIPVDDLATKYSLIKQDVIDILVGHTHQLINGMRWNLSKEGKQLFLTKAQISWQRREAARLYDVYLKSSSA
jgi:hypothetical protein